MFVLVLFIYAGVFSKGDNVAVTSVNGFASQSECQMAGNMAEQELVVGTSKSLRFICVKQAGLK